ncbi:MAG TPA: sulfatase-like hydrolase/transferase [Vicinamibacterales bacterium]
MRRGRFAQLRWSAALVLTCTLTACTSRVPENRAARHLLLITIDTLRADHVGAYGYSRGQTKFIDSLAASGVHFGRAYAAAPITLPSHATLLTGRYPPGHGSRDNGMHVSDSVPTLATELKAHGFKTAAFVAAFPLDHQFGLARGFDVYGDRLPRDASGRQMNERPASQVVDEAIAWLHSALPDQSAPRDPRVFMWVHVFEPHAPYGNPADGGSPLDRYDNEIGIADRELGRLWQAFGNRARDSLVVVAGDHGESFGEHGEYAHSIFVYDTTLRVPLVMSGPGIPSGDASERRGSRGDAVTLADVAPTAMRLLGFTMADVDGVDLAPSWSGGSLGRRELYAESFAPFVEFGWAPLRTVRSGVWKYIAAPEPELYDLEHDGAEQQNLHAIKPEVAVGLEARVNRYSSDRPGGGAAAADTSAAERLRSLGYSSGSRRPAGGQLPDPKERKELAARIARVVSGELTGDALVAALEGIVHEDPANGQAHLRLGHVRLERGDCARAEPEFHAAIATGLPTADAYTGLASCLGKRGDLAGAATALNEARRVEPGNPVVTANLGILKASQGDLAGAVELLKAAIAEDPGLLEARFNLALALAKGGRTAEARSAARELLQRLPAQAPQRAEVERLLRAIDARQ